MKFTVVALLLACALGAATAQTTTYSLMLVGEEQSPPVDTTAYAMIVISFNTDSNNITYNLTFNEVPFPMAAHIHVNAGPGGNGSVGVPLFMGNYAPFPDAPPVSGLVASNAITPQGFVGPLEMLPNYSNTNVGQLLSEYIQNDLAYVQVHTMQYPYGFIRANFNASGILPGVSVTPAMAPAVVVV